MSDTANETKLREAIQKTLNTDEYLTTQTIQRFRKVLAETEPKHSTNDDMSDTNETTQLRVALKAIEWIAGSTPSRDALASIADRARKVLAETEKHAAVVLYDEWWAAVERDRCAIPPSIKQTAMHFFKAGLLNALPMVKCDMDHCGRITKQRIRDAAEKVPST